MWQKKYKSMLALFAKKKIEIYVSPVCQKNIKYASPVCQKNIKYASPVCQKK